MCSPELLSLNTLNPTKGFSHSNQSDNIQGGVAPGSGSQDASAADLEPLRKTARQAAAAAAASGQSTTLSGAAGVSPALLALGKNTLLGT